LDIQRKGMRIHIKIPVRTLERFEPQKLVATSYRWCIPIENGTIEVTKPIIIIIIIIIIIT
jgi:hypothetical protein